MIKDFYQRFGIKVDVEQAKRKFISRASSSIFEWFDEIGLWTPDFLRWFSEEVGEDWHKHIYKSYGAPYISSGTDLSLICNKDFIRCLMIIEFIYKYLNEVYEFSNKKTLTNVFNSKISVLFDKSEIDLGVYWKDGKFLPSGAELLDQVLVKDLLDWLNEFPNEKKDFDNSLKAFMTKRYNDVIADCYNCVEGIVREILENNKVLDNNKDEFLKKLKISQEWKSIVNGFINYANEYKRHASDNRYKVNPNEVEAFIYLTGLIIRLCIKK